MNKTEGTDQWVAFPCLSIGFCPSAYVHACVWVNMLFVCCVCDWIGGVMSCCKSVSTKSVVPRSTQFLTQTWKFSSPQQPLPNITRHLCHMYVGKTYEQLAYLLEQRPDQICSWWNDRKIESFSRWLLLCQHISHWHLRASTDAEKIVLAQDLKLCLQRR